MEFDEYQKNKSEYRNGVKQINYFEWRPSHKKEIYSDKLIPYELKYELHFTKDGKLFKSVHYFKTFNYTLSYNYDENNLISRIDKADFSSKRYKTLSEFQYDKQARLISEKIYLEENVSDDITFFSHNVHEYLQNQKLCISFRYDINFEVFRLYRRYNNYGKLTEEKLVKDFNELILWDKLEYDNNGDLIKISALNDNQSVDNIYIYFPDVNGLRSGYKSFSKDINYTRSYEYDLNEKGHWIRERAYNDNKLLFINKRDIFYY